jgi:hypothetical protein
MKRVCGQATAKEEKKLIKVVTDPDETDFDEDQIVIVKRLAKEVLHEGISYADKDGEETEIQDMIVTTMFSHLGLDKELKIKPVSQDPMTIDLAVELFQAGQAAALPLLPTILHGRRYGDDAPSLCNYVFLSREELAQVKAEALKLRDDRKIKWKFPDTPQLIDKTLINCIDDALKDPSLWLYGHLT